MFHLKCFNSWLPRQFADLLLFDKSLFFTIIHRTFRWKHYLPLLAFGVFFCTLNNMISLFYNMSIKYLYLIFCILINFFILSFCLIILLIPILLQSSISLFISLSLLIFSFSSRWFLSSFLIVAKSSWVISLSVSALYIIFSMLC